MTDEHPETAVDGEPGSPSTDADRSADELLARLQQISDRRGVRIDLDGLRSRIGAAAAGGGRTDRAVRLAGRLHRWRQEMIDGSRSRQSTVD